MIQVWVHRGLSQNCDKKDEYSSLSYADEGALSNKGVRWRPWPEIWELLWRDER